MVAPLFLVLRAMTRRLWPSALVAAVFAIPSLARRSVAWVTERKEHPFRPVLCVDRGRLRVLSGGSLFLVADTSLVVLFLGSRLLSEGEGVSVRQREPEVRSE